MAVSFLSLPVVEFERRYPSARAAIFGLPISLTGVTAASSYRDEPVEPPAGLGPSFTDSLAIPSAREGS